MSDEESLERDTGFFSTRPSDDQWKGRRFVAYAGVSTTTNESPHRFRLESLTPPMTLMTDYGSLTGVARSDFAIALVNDALSMPINEPPGFSPAIERLSQMLRCAVQARDATATSVIWMRFDEQLEAINMDQDTNEDRPNVGMGHVEFTHELLTFLIFHVRQPKLVMFMIFERDQHLFSSKSSHPWDDWRPKHNQANPTEEATGMVAAVMDAVHSLRTQICGEHSSDARHTTNRIAWESHVLSFGTLFGEYAGGARRHGRGRCWSSRRAWAKL